MRIFLLVTSILLSSLHANAQQRGGAAGAGGRGGAADQAAAPAEPGFECFDRVETPEYPAAALQSRVDGVAWLQIQLNAQGKIDKLDSKVVSAWGTAPTLFAAPVEKAVRASTFKAECAGKTVAVAYQYRISGEATANPKATAKRETSRVMSIESQPQSAPAPRGGAPAR